MDGTYTADRKRKAESIADDATKFCEAIQAGVKGQCGNVWESSSLPLDKSVIFCISIPLNKHMCNKYCSPSLLFPEVCFKTIATIFVSETCEAQHSVQSKKLALTGKPA